MGFPVLPPVVLQQDGDGAIGADFLDDRLRVHQGGLVEAEEDIGAGLQRRSDPQFDDLTVSLSEHYRVTRLGKMNLVPGRETVDSRGGLGYVQGADILSFLDRW